jgi:hypothetical protein
LKKESVVEEAGEKGGISDGWGGKVVGEVDDEVDEEEEGDLGSVEGVEVE